MFYVEVFCLLVAPSLSIIIHIEYTCILIRKQILHGTFFATITSCSVRNNSAFHPIIILVGISATSYYNQESGKIR